MGSDLAQRNAALDLVRMIAGIKCEGEDDGLGGATEWENDDIFELLHALINEAREILA